MFKTLSKKELMNVDGGQRKVRLCPVYYGNRFMSYRAEWEDTGIIEYRYDTRSGKYEPIYEPVDGPINGDEPPYFKIGF